MKETKIRLYAEQAEAKSRRKLELLKKRKELEEAEVIEELKDAQEKLHIAEMIESLAKSKQRTYTIDSSPDIHESLHQIDQRKSTSYFKTFITTKH